MEKQLEVLKKKRTDLEAKKKSLEADKKKLISAAASARRKARDSKLYVMGLVLEKVLQKSDASALDTFEKYAQILKRESDKKRYIEAIQLIKNKKPLGTLDFENKNE